MAQSQRPWSGGARQHRSAVKGREGPHDARRLVAGPIGPKGDEPEGNRPTGRHRGCGPYRLHGPGECGSPGRRFMRASNSARGLAVWEDQGPGARRLLVASRCDQPGAGFQGRHALWSMGSRGERSLLLVVVQRRSARSGWVSGGAGTPPPERMKRRTFLWCDEARCRGSATAWGMQRGRAAVPLPRLRCITPHILHVALSAPHPV